MKKITPLFFTLLFSINLLAQQETLVLHYKTDSSLLNQDHHFLLESFLQDFSIDQIKRIEITGHTDTTASLSYNQTLSQKRAMGVQSFFISKQFPDSIIKISWHGELMAVSNQDLGEDRKVSIDVFLKTDLENNDQESTEIAQQLLTSTISDLYEKTSLSPQEFYINPKKDTILHCRQGTIINIPANSFALNSLQIKSDALIRFQVKEVFNYSEMILENLTTTSDNQILETQGMVYTNATLENDTLQLKNDIEILIPTDDINPNAGIFDGTRDPHSDVMNWAVNNNSVLKNFDVFNVTNCMKYNGALNYPCVLSSTNLGVPTEEQLFICYYSFV